MKLITTVSLYFMFFSKSLLFTACTTTERINKISDPGRKELKLNILLNWLATWEMVLMIQAEQERKLNILLDWLASWQKGLVSTSNLLDISSLCKAVVLKNGNGQQRSSWPKPAIFFLFFQRNYGPWTQESDTYYSIETVIKPQHKFTGAALFLMALRKLCPQNSTWTRAE